MRKRKVAIIGSRNISSISKKFLIDISGKISKTDIVLVHGNAKGVDHYASCVIDSEQIAVYPTFPKSIRRSDAQLQISEFPSKKAVNKGLFLLRNRIIVGLADLVLVVQARSNSGSYQTGLKALELKKSVVVFLPNFRDEFSGSRILQKQGARAVKTSYEFISLFDKLV